MWIWKESHEMLYIDADAKKYNDNLIPTRICAIW